MIPKILSQNLARACGLRPLCGPYQPEERWMLDNVMADLRRARRRFVLVAEDSDCATFNVFAVPAVPAYHTADSLE